MDADPRNRSEWKAAVAAVDAGGGDEYGLDERHLRRAEDIRFGSDGEVTFRVERHPSLFGQQTVGRISSAFARVVETYRFHPADGFSTSETTYAGNELNYPMAAEELVSPCLEALHLDLSAAKTEAEARTAAEKFARGIDWVGFSDYLTDAERTRLTDECIALAITKLVDRWRGEEGAD